MAQSDSAPAKDGPPRAGAPEPPDEEAAQAQRRRAAAYLDLWERQLRHAASQGPGATARGSGRRPAAT